VECWSVQHHIAAVKAFIRTRSITATQHGFQLQFQTRDAPNCSTLALWISKWCHEGTVKDSNHILCIHSVTIKFPN
jgi:hypothetical protein